jgi:hypothetical protein
MDARGGSAFGERLQLQAFTCHQPPKANGGIMRAGKLLHGGPCFFNPQRMGITRKARRDPVCGKAIGARPIIAQNGAFQHQCPQQVEAAGRVERQSARDSRQGQPALIGAQHPQNRKGLRNTSDGQFFFGHRDVISFRYMKSNSL